MSVRARSLTCRRFRMPASGWLPLIAALLPAAATAETALRGFDWGVMPETVAAAESAELLARTPERLIYRAELGGLDTVLTYRFPGNRLVQARYFNRQRHADRRRYIRDYERMKQQLSLRHGEPDTDLVHWHNELFRDDPARHGDAIAAGHLVYAARWLTERTEIRMTLRGDRLQVAHELVFTDAATVDSSTETP